MCVLLTWASLSTVRLAMANPADDLTPAVTIAGMSVQDCVHDLQDENRVVRLRSIHTLGAFDQAAGQALIAALGHHDPAVRFLAATHLGRIGGDPLKSAQKTLESLAMSPDEPLLETHSQPHSVRIAAAYALCESGQTERYLPLLIEALSYPERGTVCYAADLIGRLGADASAATSVLEQSYADNKPGVAGGDYHIGGAAMNALRKIRGQQ